MYPSLDPARKWHSSLATQHFSFYLLYIYIYIHIYIDLDLAKPNSGAAGLLFLLAVSDIYIVSKIQLVVYYQCCILIG